MNCRPPPRSVPEGLDELRSGVSGLQQRSSSTSVGAADAVSVSSPVPGDGVSALCEVFGRLRPGATAAGHDHAALCRALSLQQVAGDDNVGELHPGEVGGDRGGAGGEDHDVRFLLAHDVGRHLRIQTNIDAQADHLIDEVVVELGPSRSEGRRGGGDELPSHVILLLEQHDGMAALGRDFRGLHAGRAAACDQNALFRSRRRLGEFQLARGDRIDGTPDVLLEEEARDASLVAGDAGVDLLEPALPRLVRPLRVGEERAPDGHEVGLAVADEPIAHFRRAQLPHGDHRNADRLLHALRIGNQRAIGDRHRLDHQATVVRIVAPR